MSSDKELEKVFADKIAQKIEASLREAVPREVPLEIRRLQDFYYDFQLLYLNCLSEALKEYRWEDNSDIKQNVALAISSLEQVASHMLRKENSRWVRFMRWLFGR